MNHSIQEMLSTIEAECKYTYGLTGVRRISPAIMQAMADVPREEFVPEPMRFYAYDNGPLPIGHGQTISQPYIVALMTHLLAPKHDDVILEVGAGSGYQAAILAKLVRQVYSVEIIPTLAVQAQQRLQEFGYKNVEVYHKDGYYGLEQYSPFDGIIVTAAASHIPQPLKEQLKPGARLIIPVGLPHSTQHLMMVEKDTAGRIFTSNVLAVAFVPLTGGTDGDYGRNPE